MNRLRTLLTHTLRAAFWFCCLMAVVCSAFWLYTLRYWGDAEYVSANDVYLCKLSHGVIGFRHDHIPAHGVATGLRTRSAFATARRADVLNPAYTADLAIGYTLHGAGDRRLYLPLWSLVSVFAIWPAIHVWRRGRRRPDTCAPQRTGGM